MCVQFEGYYRNIRTISEKLESSRGVISRGETTSEGGRITAEGFDAEISALKRVAVTATCASGYDLIS